MKIPLRYVDRRNNESGDTLRIMFNATTTISHAPLIFANMLNHVEFNVASIFKLVFYMCELRNLGATRARLAILQLLLEQDSI